MSDQPQPVIVTIEDRTRDGWDDAVRGRVSWHTLFSRDLSPTNAMSAGIAAFQPGDILKSHRHSQPEIYFIFEGTGLLTIEGRESVVTAGSSVFIPGDAEHGIRNESGSALRLFYVFPVDAFSEVVYRFPDKA